MPSELSNEVTYTTPKYNFPDRVSTTLKNDAIAEIKKTANAALINASTLRRELNQTTYNFNSNSNSSYLSQGKKIINITFLPTNYINEFGQQQATPQLELDICVINFSNQHTSIDTLLMNDTGSIKQIVNSSDWVVNISGILIGTFQNPTPEEPLKGKPIDEIRKLIELYKSKISIEVSSDQLNLIGVDRLFIKSIDIPQETEFKNIQRFSLQCLSDSEDINII